MAHSGLEMALSDLWRALSELESALSDLERVSRRTHLDIERVLSDSIEGPPRPKQGPLRTMEGPFRSREVHFKHIEGSLGPDLERTLLNLEKPSKT